MSFVCMKKGFVNERVRAKPIKVKIVSEANA